MHIVVCLATVIDPDERVDVARLQPEASDGLRRLVNAADACALEAGLRLKDSNPGFSVEALTVGSADALSALRWALALGADHAELLSDALFVGSDCRGVSRILAAAIRRRGAALVLCGGVSGDGNGGAVGPMLAELLAIPLVNGASSLVVRDSIAHVERRLDSGRRAAVRCRLPAVMTVEEGSFSPRYPRVRNRLAAQRAEIPVIGAEGLGLLPGDVGQAAAGVVVCGLSGPKPNQRGITAPDASLSPEDQFAQLMSGGIGMTPGATAGLRRGPADQIEEALRFMAERRFIQARQDLLS